LRSFLATKENVQIYRLAKDATAAFLVAAELLVEGDLVLEACLQLRYGVLREQSLQAEQVGERLLRRG